jgi:hypothetical protein
VTVRIRWQQGRRALVYPVPPPPGQAVPRTAILLPWFSPAGEARVFPSGWGPDVAAFMPCAVAGSLEQLVALAGLATPTHAVIVLLRAGQQHPTEADRDRLWRSFRVPVFEQIVGQSGELLAAECEAHDGMHITSPRLRVTGERIERAPCACGRETPRLASAEPVEVLRRVAAFSR